MKGNIFKLKKKQFGDFHCISILSVVPLLFENEIIMKNISKTKEDLIQELQVLRQENNAIKTSFENFISDNKGAVDRLTISETNYRRLFESAKDGIILLDAESGMITDVNPFLIELLGYSKDQFLEKKIWDIGFFKDIAANEDKFLELQQRGYVRYDDLPLETIDGKVIRVEFVSNVYPVNHHSVIQCNIRDITKRKKAEDAFRKSEEKYRTIFENVQDVFYQVDLSGIVIEISPSIKHFSEFSREEIINKNVSKLYYNPDDREVLLRSIIQNGEVRDYELRLKTKDGKIKVVSINASLIYGSDGTPIHIDGSLRDITERKKFEEELVKAKERAEESDRLKSAFLANMSHEIRTPMNGILGFTELLKRPNLSGERQKEFIGIIEESGTRMLNIINDIINISKIESGMVEVSFSETNVNEQLDYIYQFFKPEVEKKGILFFVKTPLQSKQSTIKTDREKLYAILTNLVKNAIKFTSAGAIEFGYKKVDNYLEFFVKDTGEGIREEKKNIIFDRFRQGSESHSRHYQGSGLGLSISKAYVEMLGGKIWEESVLGKGSTFYFTIPYVSQQVENSDNELATPKENWVTHDSNADGETNPTKIIGVTPATREENQKPKLKILIAEDDEASAHFLSTFLEIYGNEINTVGTGGEAVEICRDNPDIDLVMMDVRMPGMNGYEATRQIRQFNQDVVIIAQTAYGTRGEMEKERAVSVGCTDYISKPINVDLLKGLILKHFNINII
jgi:PAS domain S-box-containing protein